MNLATTEMTMLSSGFIAFMIGCLIGMFGMMGMYSVYPDIIMEEPSCYCPNIHEMYDQPRQMFSISGWIFAGIPLLIWKIKVNRDIESDYVAQQSTQMEGKD